MQEVGRGVVTPNVPAPGGVDLGQDRLSNLNGAAANNPGVNN
jgi:hypothetical protein